VRPLNISRLPAFSQTGISEKVGQIGNTVIVVHEKAIIRKIRSRTAIGEPSGVSRRLTGNRRLTPFGSPAQKKTTASRPEVAKMLFCRFFIYRS
jgi:hypothetical protein